MKKARVIAQREILSLFKTPLAFVLMSAFLFLSGFFFFSRLQWFNTVLKQAALYRSELPTINSEVIAPYFHSIEIILIFLIPALSMRAITEEVKAGTFELLMTSPLKLHELVIGKFVGLASVLLAMLLLSVSFPLALSFVQELELAPVFIGIFGLFLFSSSFLALGVFLSCFTRSSTIAVVLGVVVMLIFYVISAAAGKLDGLLKDFLVYLAPSTHTSEFYRGVFQSSDFFYFLSLILVFLFAASKVLELKRGR